MAVTAKGKPALTHYKTIKTFGTATRQPVASLVECKLATGRTHQIRVHLASLCHPVVGDKTYGGRVSRTSIKSLEDLVRFPRQALHAIALQFIHPRSGKTVKFVSTLPDDMQSLLKQLKKL